MAPAQRLQQIILSQSSSAGRLTHPSEANISLRRKEKIRLEASLEASCRRSTWPKDSHLACSPHPILIDPQHDAAVRAIHEALVLAITSIVERWWTDSKANFPQRMPLEPQEEALLQVSRLQQRFFSFSFSPSFFPVSFLLAYNMLSI
jgi:hypothetical protein